IRKPLHVIHTTPADWKLNGVDLCPYISKVNGIKRDHAVFFEESPASILPCNNSNILFLWKASTRTKEEALLILNKYPWQRHEFWADHASAVRVLAFPPGTWSLFNFFRTLKEEISLSNWRCALRFPLLWQS